MNNIADHGGHPDVIMVRHAQSVGNLGWRTSNMPDIGLTEKGYQQAELLTDNILRKFGRFGVGTIIVTPYRRTLDTVRPLIARTGIVPTIWPDLRELTYLQPSRADNTSFDDRAGMRREFWAATRNNPNYTDPGELELDSAQSFINRIRRSLGKLADIAANVPGIVVGVSHEYTISAMANRNSDKDIIEKLCEKQKPDPRIRNTQAVGFTLKAGRLILAQESDIDLFPILAENQ